MGRNETCQNTGTVIVDHDKQIHAIVRGRVQGVGFRAFTQKKAHELGLNGWVRNLRTGEVEVEAEGTQQDLEAFLLHLKKGPLFSAVEEVTVDWKVPNRQTKGFTIRG